MSKTWMGVLGALALLQSPVFASISVNYDFENLGKTNKTQLAQLGRNLSHALNSLQECPTSVRNSAHFGTAILKLSGVNDRTGFAYQIVARGSRPAPSFQPYEITIKVAGKFVPDPHPVPDKPMQIDYTCSAKEVDQNP